MDRIDQVSVGDITIGGEAPLVLIAGPCVLESEDLARQVAERLQEIAARYSLPYIFKASFDKANRTSLESFRGPGLEEGLGILERIKGSLGVPVLTDVHLPTDCAPVAEVVDILQIPAFLCRQTDLLVAAARTGKVVNIKKGQFMAPWDMENAVDKVRQSGNGAVLLTDRGTSFGYNTLVSDFRALPVMQQFCPVVFDATHSVQQPGGLGGKSGGQRQYIPLLARAAVAAGCDALFMEVHPHPDQALSDASSMFALEGMDRFLKQISALATLVRSWEEGKVGHA